MSPEAQQIAIAEVCGWKITGFCYGDESQRLWSLGETMLSPLGKLPNYLSDLNVMHEAEVQLMTADIWPRYLGHLQDSSPMFTHRATAAQRAEAFLKTLNLWDDTK